MKAIYRSIDDSMHEQPEMKEPRHDYPRGDDAVWEHSEVLLGKALIRAYEKEKSSLRIIPCSCPHSWEDGKEYEEKRDYVVWNKHGNNSLVVPLSHDQNELWQEFQHDFLNGLTWPEIKSKFSISRKPIQ